MVRRDILKSAVSMAAASAIRGTPSVASPSQSPSTPRSGLPGPFIETGDGERLFFKDWGSGAPIVFLAAWALPSDMWDYQMAPLSEEGFRTVAYDRRGHGRSSRPGGGYDYDTLADDLAAVLNALDLHEVTLVGMSMAGGEIVRYLTRHGARRIARVVFVGTNATPFLLQTPDNPHGIPAKRFEDFQRRALLRDYPQWLEDNRQPFFVPETSRSMQDWIKMLMLGTSMQALVGCSRSQASTDFRGELRKIGVPALIIHGDNDVSAPIDLTGRPTAELIPGAELRVYEGAPHGLFLTHTERLTDDIRRFAQG